MNIISVAMATYNGEKYIKEQLLSICQQNMLPNEVIVSDDGSKDRTLEIVKEMAEVAPLSIKTYINRGRHGFIGNFRNALSHCSGDYIFLCDQDDIWEKDKVSSSIEIIKKTNASVLCTGFRLIDKDGLNLDDINRFDSSPICGYKDWTGELKQVTTDRLVWGNFCPGCTYCCTSNVVSDFLYINNNEMSHDYQLLMLGSINNNSYYYDKPLSRYRIHGENAIGATIKRGGPRHIVPRVHKFLCNASQLGYELPLNKKILYAVFLVLKIPFLKMKYAQLSKREIVIGL